jgi:hypothetical protein
LLPLSLPSMLLLLASAHVGRLAAWSLYSCNSRLAWLTVNPLHTMYAKQQCLLFA